ncbi:histidinol-phosphatase [Marinilongibacter aquaticus]|uniref:histidinol-phosphatase n=1 Tax=Marinilongibacter aquaticus TaxID=2975157 RepID=UPI0021BD1498|nr:histidinol-phosphatase [Marinilongibacter aquaticus]UBM59340.1 histidinol-phosphatase [Marinilongibacter aquaticus]
MYKNLLSLLALSSLLLSCNPSEKKDSAHWYKGNLHTHSYWSDGDEFPEMIMDWYKTRDYDFLALTDHNTLAEGEKWINIRPDSIYQEAFQTYLAKYDSSWVNSRYNADNQIEVKLKTLSEYAPLFQEEGKFLIIQSEEVTDGFEGKPIHMNAHNLEKPITPRHGNSVAEVIQNNIDAVLERRRETGRAIIPHLNHPNFGYGVSLDDMLKLHGERFFEVYNGHPTVHNLGDSTHISTEEMWDLINISYLKAGKPIMFGMATDDSHQYHHIGAKWSNSGRGWVVVKSDTLTAEGIITAMEKGDFYSSTGVELNDVKYTNNSLHIEAKPVENLSYTFDLIACKKGDSATEIIETLKGNSADFEFSDEYLFVRCKITSSRKQVNPVEGMVYEMAWTQPVQVAD